MAGLKVVTRKLILFQGDEEEFSNVYYFGDGVTGGTSTSDQGKDDLIRAVITEEKKIFAADVRFLGGTAYDLGPLGGAVEGSAYTVELPATGNNGAMPLAGNMYKECAIDLRLFLGGRRYLRSLLHTCNNHGLGLDGSVGGTLSAQILAFRDKMLSDSWPGGFERMAPNGDRPTSGGVMNYLEHRQFHRYKRREPAGII